MSVAVACSTVFLEINLMVSPFSAFEFFLPHIKFVHPFISYIKLHYIPFYLDAGVQYVTINRLFSVQVLI
jgi:hypothetical protein